MPTLIISEYTSPVSLFLYEQDRILLLVTKSKTIYCLWGQYTPAGLTWNATDIKTVASNVDETVAPTLARTDSGVLVVNYKDADGVIQQVISKDMGLTWT